LLWVAAQSQKSASRKRGPAHVIVTCSNYGKAQPPCWRASCQAGLCEWLEIRPSPPNSDSSAAQPLEHFENFLPIVNRDLGRRVCILRASHRPLASLLRQNAHPSTDSPHRSQPCLDGHTQVQRIESRNRRRARQSQTVGQALLASRAVASQGFAGLKPFKLKNQIPRLAFTNQLTRCALLESIVRRVHPFTDLVSLNISSDKPAQLFQVPIFPL